MLTALLSNFFTSSSFTNFVTKAFLCLGTKARRAMLTSIDMLLVEEAASI